VCIYIDIYFVTSHSFNQQEGQRPYNKPKKERRIDLFHYKWDKREGVEGKVNGNVA
jgi:hypothetical protein